MVDGNTGKPVNSEAVAVRACSNLGDSPGSICEVHAAKKNAANIRAARINFPLHQWVRPTLQCGSMAYQTGEAGGVNLND